MRESALFIFHVHSKVVTPPSKIIETTLFEGENVTHYPLSDLSDGQHLLEILSNKNVLHHAIFVKVQP